MGSTVFDQVALPGERLGADGATERLDSAVQLEMGFAVLLAGEAFGADGARVGPVARVRAHVDVQIPAQGELLSAAGLRTGEPTALRVDADVALQVAEARKRLVAPVAAERTGGRRR